MVVGEYAVDDDADGADDGESLRDADMDWIFQEDALILISLILDFFLVLKFNMKMILNLSLLPLFTSQVILSDCHNQAFLDIIIG